MDRFVPEVASAQLVNKDCSNYLYCGLPYLVPVLSMIWKTHFLPAPPPTFDKPAIMNVMSREKINIGERIAIELTGSHYSRFLKKL